MTITSIAAPAIHDPKWSDRGLCRYEDGDLWFPDGNTGDKVLAQITEARRICNLCPVRPQCLDDVMEVEGGKMPDGRFGIRAARRPMSGSTCAARPSARPPPSEHHPVR